MTGLTSDDRGVSEVVAFTLTFALIVGTISLVFSTGLLSLNDLRANEQIGSADNSMQKVATTLTQIHQEEMPRRTVRFALAGGSLNLRNSSINVTVTDDTGSGLYDESLTTRSLVFASDDADRTIAIENGGVFYRTENGGTVVRSGPPFRCGEDTALVSTIRLNGSTSVDSQGTVEVSGERLGGGLTFPNVTDQSAAEAANVTINVTDSRNAAGLEQFFERPDSNWQGGDGVYYCEVDRAFVRTSTIEVDVSI